MTVDAEENALAREIGQLRKTVLRQGHAQELFQARVEEAVARLSEMPAPAPPALLDHHPPQHPGAVTRSEVYYTLGDDQELVAVEVYQGESSRCSENTLIGHFPFPLLPAPAESPVVVEFRYDLDGIIRVAVHQKGTDNRQEVTLSTRSREAVSGASSTRPVENYILRKARTLADSLPEGEQKERLAAAARIYEDVLADPNADPDDVDPAEEDLLELLEETEMAATAADAQEASVEP